MPTPSSIKGKGGGFQSTTSSDALDADYLQNMSKATAKAAAVKGFQKPTSTSSSSVPIPTSGRGGDGGDGGGGGGSSEQFSSTPTPTQPMSSTPSSTPSATSEPQGGWEEVRLPDGRTYYYHRTTRARRWDKPSGAMAEAMEQRIQDQERQKLAAVEERKRLREEAKKQEQSAATERLDISSKTTEEVKTWSKNSDIICLLNTLPEIFEGAPSPSPPLTLSSTSSEVKRAYLKAIRSVHPDKIGVNASVEKRVLSQAVFGVINNLYERKKRVEGW